MIQYNGKTSMIVVPTFEILCQLYSLSCIFTTIIDTLYNYIISWNKITYHLCLTVWLFPSIHIQQSRDLEVKDDKDCKFLDYRALKQLNGQYPCFQYE
jgi:hypothetical protein